LATPIDKTFLFLYNRVLVWNFIMKKLKTKQSLVKVKSRFNQDILFTSPEWPTKEIDGVVFVPVKVRENDSSTKLMRKDNLERVK